MFRFEAIYFLTMTRHESRIDLVSRSVADRLIRIGNHRVDDGDRSNFIEAPVDDEKRTNQNDTSVTTRQGTNCEEALTGKEHKYSE